MYPFWDREIERRKLREYLLNPNPDSVMFIYGPKGSGKSSLVFKVLRDLKRELRDLWKADIHVFKLSGEKLTDDAKLMRMIREEFRKAKDVQIQVQIIDEDDIDDDGIFVDFEPFDIVVPDVSEIADEITRSERGLILVFDGIDTRPYFTDEGDIDEAYRQLKGESFRNFFEFINMITAETNSAHVIVTASSLFMVDHVLRSHVLRSSAEIMSVDYLDDKTAVSILTSEGLKIRDAKYFVRFVGGIPKLMRKALVSGDVRETVKEIYRYSKIWMYELFRGEKGFKRTLQRVLSGENLYHDERYFGVVRRLTDMGILYIDVLDSKVRFTSKIEKNVVSKILKSKGVKREMEIEEVE